jgi:exopolysaccharide biosynthesis polyprenyl glycosylphosphotransferase
LGTDVWVRGGSAQAPIRPAIGAEGNGRSRVVEPVHDGASERTSRIADAEGSSRVLRRERLYRRTLGCSDVICAALAVVTSIEILGSGEDHLRLETLLALPLVVLASKLVGLYDRDELLLRKTTLEEAPAIFQLATSYTMTVWLLQPVFVDGALGQRQVFGLWMMLFLFGILGRTIARAIARRVVDEERCVVIGDLETAKHLKAKLESDAKVKATVVGVLGFAASNPAAIANGHLRESISLLQQTIVDLRADRALLSPKSVHSPGLVELVRAIKALGVRVTVYPGTAEIVGSSVEPDEIAGLTVLGVRRFGMTRSSQMVKRGFDLIGSALVMLVAFPLFIAFCVAIKLDSRGPLFFTQTRVGRDGKRFKIFKFRTMEDGADAKKADLRELNEADGLFKIAHDPRVTRVGGFLRHTSLDELPQLLNVLKGEMSLVGPRPLVIDDDDRVGGWYRHRLDLTPGMTGHWQILGSSRIPLHEMVEIDYLYVTNWSVWTDVKILIRTVPHVLARNGL